MQERDYILPEERECRGINANIDRTGVCVFVVLLGWGGLTWVIGFDGEEERERETGSQDIFAASGCKIRTTR